MKNLKKTLCLVLAIAMIMSMMVFTTSAADFTDKDKIVNTEAVNTMVALNIINGKDDGSYFDPTGIVTRAEMAKMICVALNGGKDPQLGTSSYSFTDTKGNWAAGYIEYCYNLGIVSGRGNGIYDPNGTVTGTEAAKMLLVAIGYNSTNEGFTGTSWAMAVNVRANQKDLYAELGGLDPSAGLTRDDAAQMVYNAVNAIMVKYTYSLTTVNGSLQSVAVVEDDGVNTILTKKFTLDTNKGYLNIVSYNKDTGKYTYTVTDNLFAAATPTTGFTKTFSTTQDLTDLYGKYVKVLTKTTSSGTTLYGMYDLSKLVVASTVGGIGTFSTNTFKADGTKYYSELATAASTPVYVFSYNANATSSYTLGSMTADKSSRIVLVSDKDNSKIDYAVVFPTSVSKVTYVGTDTLTTAAGAYDFDEDKIESGLAKDNYVQITAAGNSFDNMNHIVKVGTVSGTVDGIDGSNKVLVGGSWYTPTGSATVGLTVGESYDLYVVGSYYYAEKSTSSATVKDILYVSAVDTVSGLGSQNVKAYLTDGTNSIIAVSKVSLTGTSAALNTVNESTNKVTVGLYTYVIKDGKYQLTKIDGTNNKAGFTNAYTSASTGFKKAVSGTNAAYINTTPTTYIADDAVVFLSNTTSGTTTVKVLTGADLKSWNSDYADTTPVVLTKAVSGLNTAKVVLLTGAAASIPTSGDTKYGYITSNPYTVKDGDNNYITYTMWNGTESLTVIDKASAASVANRAKGSFVTYTLSSGTTSSSTYIESTSITPTKVAITGYDGLNISMVNATTGAADATVNLIDEDTKFMYLKTSEYKGVAGGEIAIATQNSYGAYIANAWYVGSGAADLIVYDIDNKIDGAVAAGTSFTVPSVTTVAGLTGSTVTWKLNGVSVTAGATYTVTPSATLVATVAQSSTALTVAADMTLTGGAGAAAAVVTAPTATGTAPTATASGTAVTFEGTAADQTYASGVYSFSWTISTAGNAYTITLA